jgi:RNA polymerase sigma-70 factor (ECF subfamily)
MLVFDNSSPMKKPAHFILLDWREGRIAAIRDFLFAPYATEVVDLVRPA